MAKFSVKRFANPHVLREIRSDNLIELLAPYSAYFKQRGARIPLTAKLKAVPDDFGIEKEVFNYEALGNALLEPDDSMPAALVDALFMIDEMSTPEGMDELLRIGATAKIDSTQQLTPADVATLFYLRAPRHLERLHSQRHLRSRKSFHCFVTREIPQGAFAQPAEETLDALEQELRMWFASKKKGDQVRVLIYPKASDVWFLVRHGEGFRREAIQKDGQSSSVFFRPEKYDIAVYTPATGQLRINACGKNELDIYRSLLGRHFFGSADYFPATGKMYSLELLRNGRPSVSCADVDGIESVTLTEIAYFVGGEQQQVVIHKAANIFAALEEGSTQMPKAAIIGARFEFVFSDSKTPDASLAR